MINNSQRKNIPTAKQILSKVPEVTIFFWIIKVLGTTVGETASDFLNVNLNFGLVGTSIVTGILLAVVLFFQFRAKKYIPSIYWTTIVLISIFGTLVTDNLTDGMGVPLEFSTILFSVLLAGTFITWYTKEKTLSIHSIFTKQREVFYWLTILFTFALGTASGDLMAESLGLGYSLTGIIICIVIATVAVSWRLGLDSVLAFWLIYIMTRPLGASLGDFLSQPQKYGGLGLGATVTSVIFIASIIGTVTFLSMTKKDTITKAEIREEIEEEIEEKSGRKQQGVLWQVAVTMVIFLLLSGTGYYWRHNVLQAQENSTPSTQALAQNDLANSDSKNADVNSAADQVSKNTQASPLGDVSSFQKITQDMLDLANAGNLSGAKTRADDLEFEWDNSQSKLKPMNGAKWTEVDNAIDKVLRQVRAVNQDAAGCKSSLEALLATLN